MLAAILLAAGGSTRFGATNKLLALWRGRPLIDHALDRLIALPARRLIVVTGRDRARIERIVRARRDPRLCPVHNPRWRAGLGGSVRRGIAATAPVDRLLLVMLGDMPGGGGALRPLLHAIRGGAIAARPVVGGRPGHPVLLRRSAALDLEPTGDAGLWPLLAGLDMRLALCPASSPALRDVDDRDALRRLRRVSPELRDRRRV